MLAPEPAAEPQADQCGPPRCTSIPPCRKDNSCRNFCALAFQLQKALSMRQPFFEPSLPPSQFQCSLAHRTQLFSRSPPSSPRRNLVVQLQKALSMRQPFFEPSLPPSQFQCSLAHRTQLFSRSPPSSPRRNLVV